MVDPILGKNPEEIGSMVVKIEPKILKSEIAS